MDNRERRKWEHLKEREKVRMTESVNKGGRRNGTRVISFPLEA